MGGVCSGVCSAACGGGVHGPAQGWQGFRGTATALPAAKELPFFFVFCVCTACHPPMTALTNLFARRCSLGPSLPSSTLCVPLCLLPFFPAQVADPSIPIGMAEIGTMTSIFPIAYGFRCGWWQQGGGEGEGEAGGRGGRGRGKGRGRRGGWCK